MSNNTPSCLHTTNSWYVSLIYYSSALNGSFSWQVFCCHSVRFGCLKPARLRSIINFLGKVCMVIVSVWVGSAFPCLLAGFPCSVFPQTAALYGLLSSGYGLVLCLPAYSLQPLHRQGSHRQSFNIRALRSLDRLLTAEQHHYVSVTVPEAWICSAA